MVPITDHHYALTSVAALRAPQGRVNTTARNNGTAMRIAAVHRVLSTLTVEQQAEIMNVYRDVAGWTAIKAVMVGAITRLVGVITRLEEKASVDAAMIRSLEADVEELTADKERLAVGITELEEKATLDAANDSKLIMQLPLEFRQYDIRQTKVGSAIIHSVVGLLFVVVGVMGIVLVYRDVAGWTAEKALMAGAITTFQEKASVDTAMIRSLEAAVKDLTTDKDRLNTVITTSEEKVSVDAARICSLEADVEESSHNIEQLAFGITMFEAALPVWKIIGFCMGSFFTRLSYLRDTEQDNGNNESRREH